MLTIVEMPRKATDAESASLMQGVAQRLKTVMAARGLNQQQVATYAGVPPGVLSGLLKGTKDQAAFSTIVKIADGLGLSLDAIAGRAPMPVAAQPASADTPADQLETRLKAMEDRHKREMAELRKETRRELREIVERQVTLLRQDLKAEQAEPQPKSKRAS